MKKGEPAQYLLSKGTPSQVIGPVQFESFTEQRIERFGDAVGRGRVGADSVGRHVTHLLRRVALTRRSIQQIRVL